jgi:hypothetical protein
VADELPPPFERRASDRLVRLKGAAVDRKHRWNAKAIEDLEHAERVLFFDVDDHPHGKASTAR